MKPPRKRTVVLSLGAVGVAGVIGAAFLFAPNQITEVLPGNCVNRYLGDRYLTVDSCDSMFAEFAVITSNPVPEAMNDAVDWEQDYCQERVDGEPFYSIAEADGEDHIICLGENYPGS